MNRFSLSENAPPVNGRIFCIKIPIMGKRTINLTARKRGEIIMAKLSEILDDRSKQILEGLDLPPMTAIQLARLRVASSRKVARYHENVASISTLKLRRDFRRSLENDCDVVS